jgi:fucose permease
VGQILAFAMSFTIDYSTSRGLGWHDVDIPQAWVPSLLASEYSFTILYNPALMATKTSILTFYVNISKNTQKFLRVSSYVTLAIVNVAGFILTFINAFQCRPSRAAYDLSVKNSSCFSILTIYLASAPINVVTNLAILLLPIPVLTGMRLPQRQKTVLIFLFALGIFVTVVDVVRIYYLQLAADSSSTQQGGNIASSLEFSYNVSLALLWSAVEVNVGIICACIPTVKPLIKVLFPAVLSGRYHNNRETPSHSQHNSSGGEKNHELPRLETAIRPSPDCQSIPPAQSANCEQDEIMMEFLTTPDMDPGTEAEPSRSPPATIPDSPVDLDFDHMRQPICMMETRGWECFKYCSLVTTFFFVWGFTYGLLTSLNNATPNMANQTLTQVVSIISVYCGAYLFGPLLIGQWVLRKVGFKATIITGLCIYCVGTLMYWPAAALGSYPGFVISNFVVGFGASISIAPSKIFMALCGPPQYAEVRLLIAQVVEIIASIFSGLISRQLFAVSVISTQWIYLGMTLVVVLISLVFYYTTLPEASDEELENQKRRLEMQGPPTYPTGRLSVALTTWLIAVFALFLLEGTIQCNEIFFAYLLATLSKATGTSQTLTTNSYYLVGTAMFAINNLIFAFLCLFIHPRVLLLVSYIGCIIFSALTMSLHLPQVNSIAAIGLMTVFFEGPMYPITWAITLRGLGKWTKLGASIMTAAQFGGCPFPFVQLAVAQAPERSVQYSYCVIVALWTTGTLFPLYLNLFPAARHYADPVS